MSATKPSKPSRGSQQGADHGVDAETKRKFREALEKKRAHAGRDTSDHSERGKVRGEHGPQTSGTQQMFRRKSG